MKASLLLEAAPWVGGRVRTVRSGRRVDYEGGPWRIHESHHRVLRLVKELGVETEQTSSSQYRGGALSVYGKHLIAHGVSERIEWNWRVGTKGSARPRRENAYTRHARGSTMW